MGVEPEVALKVLKGHRGGIGVHKLNLVTGKLLRRFRHVTERRHFIFVSNRTRTVAADRVPRSRLDAGSGGTLFERVAPSVIW
jgi:hypothetical protein